MRCFLFSISLILISGCSLIHDVEVTRQDITEAEAIVENDIEPRLRELKDTIIAVEVDFRKERQKAKYLWEQDIEPRIRQFEVIAGNIESDLSQDIDDIAQLWQVKIEPRIARLEKLIADIELKVEDKLHKALVDWHKDVESHLLHLENLSKTSKSGINIVAKSFQRLKVDLRSIKIQLANAEQKQHINNLIIHLENLEKPLVLTDNITQARNNIEGELSALFKKI